MKKDTLKFSLILFLCLYEMLINRTSFLVPSVLGTISALGLIFQYKDYKLTKVKERFNFFKKEKVLEL